MRRRGCNHGPPMRVPPDFGVSNDAFVSLTLPNNLHSMREPEAHIMSELRRCGYDDDTTFAIKLAFEEAITNAVKHGNRGDQSKHVHLRYYIDPQRAAFMVRDEGPGFRPEDVPDCTADENLERPCGRGVMLMHSYMTKVCYKGSGNEVWLLKVNPAREPEDGAGPPS